MSKHTGLTAGRVVIFTSSEPSHTGPHANTSAPAIVTAVGPDGKVHLTVFRVLDIPMVIADVPHVSDVELDETTGEMSSPFSWDWPARA